MGTTLSLIFRHFATKFSNLVQNKKFARGGAVTHVQACLGASKDGESSFQYCGSPVKDVQTCFWAGNTLQRRFNRRAARA